VTNGIVDLGPFVDGLALHTPRLQRSDEVLPARLQRVRTNRDRFQGLIALEKFEAFGGREYLEK
jgi:hypothetical protein